MILNLDLLDVWRDMHPETRRYTWRRNSPFQQSRLDFFLISDLLRSYVTEADIKPGYKTDHSIITMTLTFSEQNKRNTFWKFNNSLLKDKQYVDEINKVIRLVTEEYAALPYNREKLVDIPKSEIQFVITDQLFLDVLLMKIRSKTISYAVARKKKNNELEQSLELKIENLENKSNISNDEKSELESYKGELGKIREKKMEGVLMRSRARWVAEGEKITKYFCELEKRNYISKFMSKIISDNGTEINKSEYIVKEVKNFYEKLYAQRHLEESQIPDLVTDIPTLDMQDKISLEGHITLDEASYSLKNMKNNKSPGSDGFTAEFLKFFWLQLGTFVVRSLNDGFEKGELSSTQKEGLIICIPKPDKPKEHIKNWRPISLLNVVYKIGSACIANRLKTVLPILIDEDQTGFMANRFIGDNIRLIYDLIHYLNIKNKQGLLLCLDFEKAFDSVDWTFLVRVLHAFGFGSDICKWIQIFYKNIKSAVAVNGQISSWFTIERGCRQGDPISPYLFILCVEILALMIRQNQNIKGIKLNDTQYKISQYADDTEIMLAGDEKSFEETINTIEKFGKNSGLFLNEEKTYAIWLGSKRNSPIRYMPRLAVKWNPSKFKILGIWFTADLVDCEKLNFNNKFLEVKKLYKQWSRRQITPLGRIAILKSLILSKLIYLWILLPNPPDIIISQLQKSIFEFIWSKKPDRINRKTAVKAISDGGLGIPDIKQYIHALKLIWIRKVKTSKHKWKTLLAVMFPEIDLLDQLGSCLPTEKYRLNKFWLNVLQAYKEVGRKVTCTTQEEIIAEPIFCNENIKVDSKTILFKSWINKGVCFVGNLLNEEGNFMSFQQFREKYEINTDFVTYLGCSKAVKSYTNRVGFEKRRTKQLNSTKLMTFIQSVNKGAKTYYRQLMENEIRPKCCLKWDDKLNVIINWNKTFIKLQKIKEISARWFQFRIVHRILATNVMLQYMGLERSNLCTFCKSEIENIEHIFWRCPCIEAFWRQFQIVMNNNSDHSNITINENMVLFGIDTDFKTDEIFEYIILQAKLFIYKCKLNKNAPFFNSFIKYLKRKFEVEKYIANTNMNTTQFNEKWQLYLFLIDT